MSCSTTPGRPTASRRRAARSSERPALPHRRRAPPTRRRSSSSSAARFAARTAARPTRSSRTSSARPRAGRFATATPAASRSSSSRRSDPACRRRMSSDVGTGLPTMRASSTGHPDHMERELAIRLRGVVKRYGADHRRRRARPRRARWARASACSAPTAPASRRRCGSSPRRRSPTRASSRCSATRCRTSPSRRGRSCGVAPQLDNLDTTLTVEQNLLVFTHLYRIGRARAARGDRARARDGQPRRPARHAGRQALGRHAPAAADRAGARAPPAARAARRADRRARPAGAPGAVGADRRAAHRGHDDPHVDALHRGGRAPRRHRADHVARHGGRHRPAGGARARARRRRGARGLRAAGAARRGRGGGGRGRAAHAADRHERLDPRRRRRATATALEGERRPANLEDVFVLLTGEEIA